MIARAHTMRFRLGGFAVGTILDGVIRRPDPHGRPVPMRAA